MTSNILARYTTISTAEQLLRRGMRPKTVELFTGLSRYVLTRLHHEIFGASAPCGRSKTSRIITRNNAMRSEASLFIKFYLYIGGDPVWTEFDIDAFVRTYDMYRDAVKKFRNREHLDINHAWALARDLRANTLRRRKCHQCGIHYVNLVDEPHAKCPICATINLPARVPESLRATAP